MFTPPFTVAKAEMLHPNRLPFAQDSLRIRLSKTSYIWMEEQVPWEETGNMWLQHAAAASSSFLKFTGFCEWPSSICFSYQCRGWFSIASFTGTRSFLILAVCCFGTLFLDESVDVNGQNSFQVFFCIMVHCACGEAVRRCRRKWSDWTRLNKFSKWVKPCISCSS